MDRQESTALTAAACLLGIAIAPPLVFIGRDLAVASQAWTLLWSGRLWLLLLRSVLLAGAVTLLALSAGVPLGVILARARLPFRRALLAMHMSVVFLPPLVPALGWFRLFGRNGIIGSETTAAVLFSAPGAVLVLASCLTPIVSGLTMLGVSGVDRSLDDAARLVARPLRVAASILVPLAAPAIGLGAVIVFALAFSELGVPAFLRVDAYPAVVFARLGGFDFAPGEAAVFVVPMLGVAAVLLVLEQKIAGRRAVAALGLRPRDPPAPRDRISIVGLTVSILAALVSLAPIAALGAHALRIESARELWSWAGSAPWNSLRAAGTAAALAALVALVAGHALARNRRVGRALDAVGVFAFVLPSAIFGVGLIAAWNRPATGWLYASFGIVALGFFARYSAVATRAFAASVAQTPESFEDAARLAGARYFRRLSRVVAGACRRGLFAAFALVLVFGLRDLETAALFYPPGGEPLPVRIFTLEANGPPAVVSALALLQIALTLAVLGVSALGFLPKERA